MSYLHTAKNTYNERFIIFFKISNDLHLVVDIFMI